MQDKHDEKMTPKLREELKMNSIIASLAELTPDELQHQIKRAQRMIEDYRGLMAQDPELCKII